MKNNLYRLQQNPQIQTHTPLSDIFLIQFRHLLEVGDIASAAHPP